MNNLGAGRDLVAARNLTPPDPEHQKREDEVMIEVLALWQQHAADEASLTKFVKAKRFDSQKQE